MLGLPREVGVLQLPGDRQGLPQVGRGGDEVPPGPLDLDAGPQGEPVGPLLLQSALLHQSEPFSASGSRPVEVFPPQVGLREADHADGLTAAIADPAGDETGLLEMLACLFRLIRGETELRQVGEEDGQPSLAADLAHDPLGFLEAPAGGLIVADPHVDRTDRVQRDRGIVTLPDPPGRAQRLLGHLQSLLVAALRKMQGSDAVQVGDDPLARSYPAGDVERLVEQSHPLVVLPHPAEEGPEMSGRGGDHLDVADLPRNGQ